MIKSLCAAALLAAPAAADRPVSSPGLAPPVAVLAGGKAIDVDVGHAAPFVADLMGEGKPQLLVGQFGEGKLRVYRNVGSAKAPRFERFEWFKAGGEVGKVESG
jgi:hypothetical protein